VRSVATSGVERLAMGDGLPRVEVRWPGSPVVAAVTTRPLNFGRDTESPAREVAAAHRALRGWAWPKFRLLVGSSQVHGTRLFTADAVAVREVDPKGPATLRLAEYDGFLTRTPGVLLTVGVADCVPAFLWMAGTLTVALLHAGWRGIAGGILDRAIEAFASCDARPEDLTAWWGPAIGPCCYPVGDEVVEAMRATSAGPDTAGWVRNDGPGTRVDLRAVLTRQAIAAGVPAEAIGRSSRCTACDPLLHSYRRAGGGGGRMLALTGLPAA
jgi:YfiH family protein